LVALWREALLAQKVLEGRTQGYTHHPQLVRFKNSDNKLKSISCYLYHIYQEAEKRGYNFDKNKIKLFFDDKAIIKVTTKQLNFEFEHLMKKLQKRDIKTFKQNLTISKIEPNPIFKVIEGEIEDWEKI
jgi:hypothetical protein